MARERILLVGDIASGKTRALFDTIDEILADTKVKIFFFSLDDGHQRFVTRPTVTKALGDRLFIYSCSSWGELRKAYREAKGLWEKGDWVMIDRLDLAWDYIMRFYKAEKYHVDEDELPDYSLTKRMELLAEADKLEAAGKGREATSIRNSVNMDGPGELDWDLLKSAIGSVTADLTGGRDAIQYQINYLATTWGTPGIQARTSGSGADRRETESSKNDPRKLRNYNMTIQGEKHVPSYFDTILIFMKLPKGYTMSTEKDRERKEVFEIVLDGGFPMAYQQSVGVDILGR